MIRSPGIGVQQLPKVILSPLSLSTVTGQLSLSKFSFLLKLTALSISFLLNPNF